MNHIRQVLDDMDNGRVPDTELGRVRCRELSLAEDSLPTAETFAGQRSQVRLSREELVDSADIDAETLDEIEEFGLIKRRPRDLLRRRRPDVASIVGEFAELGLEPRHLRMFVAAADREIALFDQVVTPRARSLDKEATDRAIASLASLSVRLHTVLVRADCEADVREVEVVGVRVEMPTNQPLVLLRETEGNRYLPIWIGAVEASAIAYAQQGAARRDR